MLVAKINITERDVESVLAAGRTLTDKHNVLMHAAARQDVPLRWVSPSQCMFDVSSVPTYFGMYHFDTYLSQYLKDFGRRGFNMKRTSVTLIATDTYTALSDSVSWRGHQIHKGVVYPISGVGLSDFMSPDGLAFRDWDKCVCEGCGCEFVYGIGAMHKGDGCDGKIRLLYRNRCYSYESFLKSI